MKKLFISMLAILACGCVCAQKSGANFRYQQSDAIKMAQKEAMIRKANINYEMTGYTTSDNLVTVRFTYDAQHRLIAYYNDNAGDYTVIDSMKYDNNGNMVRLDGYQWLNNTWQHVYYITYKYDNNNNRISRTNYNQFQGEWNLGGVYNYTYNSNNQLIYEELTMGTRTISTVDYTYENGKLATETWSYSDFSGGFEPSEKMCYYYTNNKLTSIEDSTYSVGSWYYFALKEYDYNNSGNMTEYRYYDQDYVLGEKSIFTYDTQYKLENTAMPVSPELERPYLFESTNIYTREMWHTLAIGNELKYAFDYIYTYNIPTAVAENKVENVSVSPNPARNMLCINGEYENIQSMDIYNMAGQKVMHINGYVNTLNISGLADGMYLIQLNSNDARITGKFVKAH